MHLSKNFLISEFCQFARHGLPELAYPSEWLGSRLKPLCDVLEVIRAVLDRPIKIVSGYRGDAYNRKIGGARNSQHVLGRAADIVVSDIRASLLHSVVLDLYKAGKIKIGGLGAYPNFLHIDIRPGNRLARWTGSRKEG